MPKVKLLAPAGMRYGDIRYQKGDVFVVSDSFMEKNPNRFELVESAPAPKKRKKKAVESAPIIEAEPVVEVISSADNTGDHSGL